MNILNRRLRRFAREEDGLVMTEFLILLPLLVWGFLALFVYWDAFRTINEAQKASYAVADLISRQQDDIDMTFINGMDEVMEMMLTDATGVRMRITSVQWDDDNEKYIRLFSRSPGNELASLTASQVLAMKDRIPVMAHKDGVVILETEVGYRPSFDVGIPTHSFDNFIVTRPRSTLRRICLMEEPCPADS